RRTARSSMKNLAEIDLDGCRDRDGLPVLASRLEFPLADRFDRLLIQSQSQATDSFDVVSEAVRPDLHRDHYGPLVFREARFFRIRRIHLEQDHGRRHSVAYAINMWTGVRTSGRRFRTLRLPYCGGPISQRPIFVPAALLPQKLRVEFHGGGRFSRV